VQLSQTSNPFAFFSIQNTRLYEDFADELYLLQLQLAETRAGFDAPGRRSGAKQRCHCSGVEHCAVRSSAYARRLKDEGGLDYSTPSAEAEATAPMHRKL